MPLSKDLQEFVALLNSNGVEYVIVGAFAVGFHGYYRNTADLDVLVRPTAENSTRLVRVLSQFGFDSMGVTAADLQAPDSVIQLGVQPNRIDMLTTISGVSFDEAWASRCDADLDGIPTHFIGREELIRNKEATGRARDLGDADELRKTARKAK